MKQTNVVPGGVLEMGHPGKDRGISDPRKSCRSGITFLIVVTPLVIRNMPEILLRISLFFITYPNRWWLMREVCSFRKSTASSDLGLLGSIAWKL